MFSQPLMKKWREALEKNYGYKNLTEAEVFEVVNTITEFFSLLAKWKQEDKLKTQEYDPNRTNRH